MDKGISSPPDSHAISWSAAARCRFSLAATRRGKRQTADESAVEKAGASSRTPKFRTYVCEDPPASTLWHNLAAEFILTDLEGNPMNDRERFLGTMKYQPVDRAPLYEFMWPTWPETAERWGKEGGYVEGKTDFGCDKWLVEFSWFWPQPPFPREILAEDDEHVTFVDPQGIVMREFKNNPLSSMPQFIRYPGGNTRRLSQVLAREDAARSHPAHWARLAPAAARLAQSRLSLCDHRRPLGRMLWPAAESGGRGDAFARSSMTTPPSWRRCWTPTRIS